MVKDILKGFSRPNGYPIQEDCFTDGQLALKNKPFKVEPLPVYALELGDFLQNIAAVADEGPSDKFEARLLAISLRPEYFEKDKFL